MVHFTGVTSICRDADRDTGRGVPTDKTELPPMDKLKGKYTNKNKCLSLSFVFI